MNTVYGGTTLHPSFVEDFTSLGRETYIVSGWISTPVVGPVHTSLSLLLRIVDDSPAHLTVPSVVMTTTPVLRIRRVSRPLCLVNRVSTKVLGKTPRPPLGSGAEETPTGGRRV